LALSIAFYCCGGVRNPQQHEPPQEGEGKGKGG